MVDPISREVAAFIAGHVTSVAELELLLVIRNNPARAWSGADLAGELRVDPAWATRQLERFASSGFIARSDGEPPTYAFRPSGPGLERLLTEVATAYLLHRVRLIELIYAGPDPGIRAIADAFRLRKDRPSG
ncbi:MAG TPA: hypothetical protein VD963_10030 [Phycisphaerales bacterium]|nr:hypothetical protein [Phycisphaerales bacterium]